MELFTKDSQKFEEFFQELEAMRGRLASLAPEGDRKELERLAMNFERKVFLLKHAPLRRKGDFAKGFHA